MALNRTYIQEKLFGSSGQLPTFNSAGDIILAYPGARAKINVHAPTGWTIVAKKYENGVPLEYTTINVTNSSVELFKPSGSDSFVTADSDTLYVYSSDLYSFYINDFGTWGFSFKVNGEQISNVVRYVNVTGAGDYDIYLGYINATINVVYPAGITVTDVICTCSDGGVVMYAPVGEFNTTFYATHAGTWTVSLKSKDTHLDFSYSVPVEITYDGQTVTVNPEIVSTVLENNSWPIIQKVARESVGSSYWSVGDPKEVLINGTVGTYTINNVRVKAYILGFNHNSTYEGLGIHFQLGKINSTEVSFYSASNAAFQFDSTNHGEFWWLSDLRTRLGQTKNSTNTFISCLPSSLVNVIRQVPKWASWSYTYNPTSYPDLIFILSLKEMNITLGSGYYGEVYTATYSYYTNANNNFRKRYDSSSTSTLVKYWTRVSEITESGGDIYFNDNVFAIGTDGDKSATAYNSYAAWTPCFVVG